MNSNNIKLFDIIYSYMFDDELDSNSKWYNFIFEINNNSKLMLFLKVNDDLLYYNTKAVFEDITGNICFADDFVILNNDGQKEYLEYKSKQIKTIIDKYGVKANLHLKEIFEGMNNESIKEILENYKNEGLINYDYNKVFLYADDMIYTIVYDNISINSFMKKINDKKIIQNENDFIFYDSLGIDDNAPKYILHIIDEINGCYRNNLYNSCICMVRKLLESLIIDKYVNNNLISNIKDNNGDIVPLSKLIDTYCNESIWTVSKHFKNKSKTIKQMGDLGSHNRTTIFTKEILDDLRTDIIIVLQEVYNSINYK